uniref:Uncharacterized protein n=1 Tax=Dromaius novaehollandiae TaxID=8790 RepID=A0A8C4JZB4_DRONO
MHRQGRASPGTATEDRSYSRLRPWVFLVSALVIKVAFLTICLVVFHHQSYDQYKTLLQNATEWHCVPNTPLQIQLTDLAKSSSPFL